MAFIETTALHKLLAVNKNGNRIHGIQGGTSASKTISIEQILIDKAQSDKKPTVTSITSESMPHLKRGACRDFKNIMKEHEYWEDARWNASDFIYTFPFTDIHGKVYPRGSQIEFFSSDMPSKVRGPRRQRLFVNEANNLPGGKETFDQLEVRTEEEVWADWNPVESFWFHDMINERDDADLTILTYKDNEGLPESIVKSIESRRHNKAWWRVYGLGLPGEVEGRIFTNWKIIDEIPHEARLENGGGDFGYARDKTAFCDIYYYNGGYIIDEITSRVGLLDTDLGNLLLNRPNPNLLYIADSADKQKIDVLRQMGVAIMGVDKKGSNGMTFTNAAISFVQGQKISITKRSTNYIKSYRNFMWQSDKDGNFIPKYDHYLSDEMMSVIYGMTNFNYARREEEPEHEPSMFDAFGNYI